MHKDCIQKFDELKLNNFTNFTELKKLKSKYSNPYFFTERLSKFVKNKLNGEVILPGFDL